MGNGIAIEAIVTLVLGLALVAFVILIVKRARRLQAAKPMAERKSAFFDVDETASFRGMRKLPEAVRWLAVPFIAIFGILACTWVLSFLAKDMNQEGAIFLYGVRPIYSILSAFGFITGAWITAPRGKVVVATIAGGILAASACYVMAFVPNPPILALAASVASIIFSVMNAVKTTRQAKAKAASASDGIGSAGAN